jgi:hypothetical protein
LLRDNAQLLRKAAEYIESAKELCDG